MQTLPISRRDFVAGAAALLTSACGIMGQIRGSERVMSAPTREDWQPVLNALITSILPFEHAQFPAVDSHAIEQQLLQLFPIEHDPEFVDVPLALVIFDDCGLFETPLAPMIADERRSLHASKLSSSELAAATERASDADRHAFHEYVRRHGEGRFVTHDINARRAYLMLWAHSALIARRRLYRAWKSLVMISAYSTTPFWQAIGYDGPLLAKG
jgi:hypothetical protein